jgi:CMP-N,N'-diacetyllegionaminic acid synthase
MIGDKKVIAIIPARGGSKGLPGKNIKDLCGKPLIVWTIETALKSKFIDELVVSTENQQIADIALGAGASVPFLRPIELATDTASTFVVVKHALDYYGERYGRTFDLVALVEPTSPLREDDDIDHMLERLYTGWAEFDSIISVGEVREHPSIMKRLRGAELEPFCQDLAQTTRRQENVPAYFPYGVAYIAKTVSLLEGQTFYTRRCTYHMIKRYQNYEIDDIYDFLCVESVMRHGRKLA